MQRLTHKDYGGSVSTFNVTIPAGVTVMWWQAFTTTTLHSAIRSIAVVPNTTYTLTIASTSYAFNNPNTLGSLLSFTGAASLRLYWPE